MTATMQGSISIGDFDGVDLDLLIRQGFRPMPVTRTELLTPDVLAVHLGEAAPASSARPGSHLEVAIPLPDGPAIRHYSLVTAAGPDPASAPTPTSAGSESPTPTSATASAPSALQIAILNEAYGRGGSSWLHENLPDCASILVRGPRDTFGYVGGGPAYFVAGGIGITPITAMVAAAEAAGTDWHLLCIGRRRESMAFAADLADRHGAAKVTVHLTEDAGRPDAVALARDWAAAHSHLGATTVYTCGPVPLMHALDVGFADDPAITVVSEDFDTVTAPARGPESSPRRGGPSTSSAPSSQVRDGHDTLAEANAGSTSDPADGADLTDAAVAGDKPFVVELADGSEVPVAVGCSIIDALGQAGVRTLSSCQKGTCGTCETVILDGEADHRDLVLSSDEHAAQETMMICVSRACGPRIALDL